MMEPVRRVSGVIRHHVAPCVVRTGWKRAMEREEMEEMEEEEQLLVGSYSCSWPMGPHRPIPLFCVSGYNLPFSYDIQPANLKYRDQN